MATVNGDGPKKRKKRVFKVLLLGAAVGGAAYAISKRQRPCSCASIPLEERVLLKDEENLSGLGSIMNALLTQLLQDPAKLAILDSLDLVLAIEPREQPETAITMTFSGGCVVIEPGVSPGAEIHIICDIEVLMQMASMGSGLDAVKFMTGPAGREMAARFRSGELKVRGLATHPLAMMRFSRLLAPAQA